MSYHHRPLTGHILLIHIQPSNPLGSSLIQRFSEYGPGPSLTESESPGGFRDLFIKPSGDSMVFKCQKKKQFTPPGLWPATTDQQWRLITNYRRNLEVPRASSRQETDEGWRLARDVGSSDTGAAACHYKQTPKPSIVHTSLVSHGGLIPAG